MSFCSRPPGEQHKSLPPDNNWQYPYHSYILLYTVLQQQYYNPPPTQRFLFLQLFLHDNICRCIQEPIRTILGPNGSYLQAKARKLDTDSKKVLCESIHNETFELDYDKLVIAVGVKTNTFGIDNIEQAAHAGDSIFFLKQLAHARAIRTNIIDSFERAALPTVMDAEKRRLLSFLVVGGGPTSCEFTAELHGRFSPERSSGIAATVHSM